MEVVDPNSKNQFTDPNVTRVKFETQVRNFKKYEANYRREGIICLGIEFPYFEFMLLGIETSFSINLPVSQNNQVILQQFTLRMQVPQYLFTIRVDYSNFDTLPPSVKVINPVTSQLATEAAFTPFITPSQQNKDNLIDKQFEKLPQNILIRDNDGNLFFCLRGLREYHEHPQHNGDSWYLHRVTGKGDILHVLDQFQLYCIANHREVIQQQQTIPFSNG